MISMDKEVTESDQGSLSGEIFDTEIDFYDFHSRMKTVPL